MEGLCDAMGGKREFKSVFANGRDARGGERQFMEGFGRRM